MLDSGFRRNDEDWLDVRRVTADRSRLSHGALNESGERGEFLITRTPFL
jgi:hypothetical protein